MRNDKFSFDQYNILSIVEMWQERCAAALRFACVWVTTKIFPFSLSPSSDCVWQQHELINKINRPFGFVATQRRNKKNNHFIFSECAKSHTLSISSMTLKQFRCCCHRTTVTVKILSSMHRRCTNRAQQRQRKDTKQKVKRDRKIRISETQSMFGEKWSFVQRSRDARTTTLIKFGLFFFFSLSWFCCCCIRICSFFSFCFSFFCFDRST